MKQYQVSSSMDIQKSKRLHQENKTLINQVQTLSTQVAVLMEKDSLSQQRIKELFESKIQ